MNFCSINIQFEWDLEELKINGLRITALYQNCLLLAPRKIPEAQPPTK